MLCNKKAGSGAGTNSGVIIALKQDSYEKTASRKQPARGKKIAGFVRRHGIDSDSNYLTLLLELLAWCSNNEATWHDTVRNTTAVAQ